MIVLFLLFKNVIYIIRKIQCLLEHRVPRNTLCRIQYIVYDVYSVGDRYGVQCMCGVHSTCFVCLLVLFGNNAEHGAGTSFTDLRGRATNTCSNNVAERIHKMQCDLKKTPFYSTDLGCLCIFISSKMDLFGAQSVFKMIISQMMRIYEQPSP